MNIHKVTGSSEDLVASFYRPDQEDVTSMKTGKSKSSEKGGITIRQSTRCHITEDNSVSDRYLNITRNVLPKKDLSILLSNYYYSGVYKSLAPGLEGDNVLYFGAQYLWILSMEFANVTHLALRILSPEKCCDLLLILYWMSPTRRVNWTIIATIIQFNSIIIY